MKIKKLLPIAGIIVLLVGVVIFVLPRISSRNVSATLKPSGDSHWLKLEVNGISSKADSMHYELIYSLPDGRVQGVPGTVELEGKNNIERDILLGTESSGTYYYDEGVEKGSLTLKFYNGESLLNEKSKDWVLEDLKNDPRVF